MAEAERHTGVSAQDSAPDGEGVAVSRSFRLRARHGLAVGAGLLALGLGLGWSQRVSIADRMIAAQVYSLHLPARYRIVELDSAHVVLADVVVGDPARPDASAKRVEVAFGWQAGLPGVDAVQVDGLRVLARWRDGRASFGVLDKLLYAPSDRPARLPDLDLRLRDARLSFAGPAGPIGLALAGRGRLSDGFAGVVSLSAPKVRAAGCSTKADLTGRLSVTNGAPLLEGPLHLGSLACQNGLHLAGALVPVKARLASTLDSGAADLALAGGSLRYGGASAAAVSGPLKLAYGQGAVNAVWDLAALRPQAGGLMARKIGLSGHLRMGLDNFRVDGEGELSGQGLAPDAANMAALAQAGAAAQGTLAAPLLATLGHNLRREAEGSQLKGRFVLHAGQGRLSAVVPELMLRGTSLYPLLEAKRLTLLAENGHLRLSGSLSSATPGLPRITAKIERDGQAVRLAMADYAAQGARLALPELVLSRKGAQGLAWQGRVIASGGLAEGVQVADLRLPLNGSLDHGGLSLWTRCAKAEFGGLKAGELALDAGAVDFCPQGGAVWRQGKLGLRLPELALRGRMGEQRLTLESGLVELAGGQLSARKLALNMGAGDVAVKMRLGAIHAALGAVPSGQFSGLEGTLGVVPLALQQAGGAWRWVDGGLVLDGMALTIADRERVERFAPLVARAAQLSFRHGAVQAQAELRESTSDRPVVQVALGHNLGSGRGFADLIIPALRFDQNLQPDMLSKLVQGTIANARGTVEGQGRIDWAGGRVTSHGSISSKGFDFAGLAGPVKGVEGTVEFTDLLGLVTAPHQSLKIASINPGIEATDGLVRFTMHPGALLEVEDARWPFLDGQMVMMPARLQLGGVAERRFELQVSGINAAKFVEQMNMSNLAATGSFDGRLPLVFDHNGGRVVGGELVSRAGGGSVSYVGELSYRDLSPAANMAFRMLRSLRFAEMRVGMDGDIAGEVVTRVSMKGLSQGKLASRNFLTRQIAKLPLQFNINLRAPFYELIGSLRSLYDSSYVSDPRDVKLTPSALPPSVAAKPATSIQPPASESRP